MPNRKYTLVAIVLLLVIFVPLALFTTILHFKETPDIIENPDREFKYNNKLYFYQSNKLLGVYPCSNTDYCDYAMPKSNYLEATLEHRETKNEKLSLIQNRYAFLTDSSLATLGEAEVILYDVVDGKEIGRYKEIKNYGVGINNDYYIVKNKDNAWGVLELSNQANVKIPFAYDYILLADNLDKSTNKIVAKTFAVFKDNTWYLVDSNNNKVSTTFFETIVGYNENYVVAKNGVNVHLFNYQGVSSLAGNYRYINFCGNYLALVDESNIFYLYDLAGNKEIGNRYNVANPSDLRFEVSGDYIRVSLGKEMIENIAIR